jgi:hypothetical protein
METVTKWNNNNTDITLLYYFWEPAASFALYHGPKFVLEVLITTLSGEQSGYQDYFQLRSLYRNITRQRIE